MSWNSVCRLASYSVILLPLPLKCWNDNRHVTLWLIYSGLGIEPRASYMLEQAPYPVSYIFSAHWKLSTAAFGEPQLHRQKGVQKSPRRRVGVVKAGQVCQVGVTHSSSGLPALGNLPSENQERWWQELGEERGKESMGWNSGAGPWIGSGTY